MPKDDLISRQAALDIIDSELNGWLTDDERLHIEGVAIGIACLPTIDPVKHGSWGDVMTEDWCTFDECKCSECGVVEYFNKGWKKFSYCPNCGAKMERNEDA